MNLLKSKHLCPPRLSNLSTGSSVLLSPSRSSRFLYLSFMSEKGQALPKFGDWDVNDPSSAEGFTMIFDKARDEKKTGSKPESPGRLDHQMKHGVDLSKPHSKKWFCCMS